MQGWCISTSQAVLMSCRACAAATSGQASQHGQGQRGWGGKQAPCTGGARAAAAAPRPHLHLFVSGCSRPRHAAGRRGAQHGGATPLAAEVIELPRARVGQHLNGGGCRAGRHRICVRRRTEGPALAGRWQWHAQANRKGGCGVPGRRAPAGRTGRGLSSPRRRLGAAGGPWRGRRASAPPCWWDRWRSGKAWMAMEQQRPEQVVTMADGRRRTLSPRASIRVPRTDLDPWHRHSHRGRCWPACKPRQRRLRKPAARGRPPRPRSPPYAAGRASVAVDCSSGWRGGSVALHCRRAVLWGPLLALWSSWLCHPVARHASKRSQQPLALAAQPCAGQVPSRALRRWRAAADVWGRCRGAIAPTRGGQRPPILPAPQPRRHSAAAAARRPPNFLPPGLPSAACDGRPPPLETWTTSTRCGRLVAQP